MLCPSCSVNSVIDGCEEICPLCGQVLSDIVFDVKKLDKNIKLEAEELSSVVMHSKKTKDSTGKLLNFTQRNIAKKLKNWQKRMRLVTAKERTVFNVNLQIDKICNSLSLSEHYRNQILDMYKELKEKDLTRGKSIASTICAITYIVSIKNKLALSFDDIVSVTELKKKKVSKVYKLYIKEVDAAITLPESSSFINKYIFYADLEQKYVEPLSITISHVLNLTSQVSKIGKGPAAYVSTLVYMFIMLKKIPVNIKNYMKKAKITMITLHTKIKLILEALSQYTDEELVYLTREELNMFNEDK